MFLICIALTKGRVAEAPLPAEGSSDHVVSITDAEVQLPYQDVDAVLADPNADDEDRQANYFDESINITVPILLAATI